jgi:hypothetical protein
MAGHINCPRHFSVKTSHHQVHVAMMYCPLLQHVVKCWWQRLSDSDNLTYRCNLHTIINVSNKTSTYCLPPPTSCHAIITDRGQYIIATCTWWWDVSRMQAFLPSSRACVNKFYILLQCTYVICLSRYTTRNHNCPENLT